MKFKLPKLPKFNIKKIISGKIAKLPKPSVDDVLKAAQYGTYAFIVGRILVYLGQQLAKLRFKAK